MSPAMTSAASGRCLPTSRALHAAVASAYSSGVYWRLSRSSANVDLTTCRNPALSENVARHVLEILTSACHRAEYDSPYPAASRSVDASPAHVHSA